ncbi:MAG TPA: hypothetical protein VGD50_03240, partial [Candidatus Baltobacteraceae bacterium]
GIALAPLVVAIVLLGVDAGPVARIEPQLVGTVGADTTCLPPGTSREAVGLRVTPMGGLTEDQTADVLSACYAIAKTGQLTTFDSVRTDYMSARPLLVPMKDAHDRSVQQ